MAGRTEGVRNKFEVVVVIELAEIVGVVIVGGMGCAGGHEDRMLSRWTRRKESFEDKGMKLMSSKPCWMKAIVASDSQERRNHACFSVASSIFEQ